MSRSRPTRTDPAGSDAPDRPGFGWQLNTRFRLGGVVLLVCALPRAELAQVGSLGDLQWSATETTAGRYVIVAGQRAFVGGYNVPGLEVWTYPLQLVRGYRISFHLWGDTTDIDGRATLRRIEQTPTVTTRVYTAPELTVRERIFVPVDQPGATISYSVEASRPVDITVHFTPSLNLMWPGAVGGQEIHWDAARSAYTLDEPSHRFRGVIVSRTSGAHEYPLNNTRGADFERELTFTLRVVSGGSPAARVTLAGASSPGEDVIAVAESLAARANQEEARARDRYARLHVVDIETPDTAVNRALRWAQVTLEQAWVCNPQLGCGLIAGYGPSRGVRRPQYAWFFANDGLVAVDALLRGGAYARAREELAFIMRRQNKRTGAIWHELSQSAGFLDWEGAYPYMFVHVDVSFDFLNTVRDYVETTGDVAFAAEHWDAIRAAYDYCRSTIPSGRALPEIPAGQQGRDEQDPQGDELTLSLAWVSAAESFAKLARLTNHADLAGDASRASASARAAIRPSYYDAGKNAWVSGHLRSGAPVEGLTSSAIALLHQGMLSEREQRALVDELASSPYRASWGIRSTPSNSPLYAPDSYARGSVWAIGTADAIMAFYEAGRGEMATALWRDLVPWFALDAPGHMHEVLRGDVFAPERESVPDQSWSSASFLSVAVRGMLGIQVDGAARTLRFAPHLPAGWDSVRVRRIDIAGTDVGLAMRRSPNAIELEIENAGPQMTLIFRPALEKGARVVAMNATEGAQVVASGERAGGYELSVSCPANRTSRLPLRLR
jgi:glycogen debranching enzyme